MRPSTDYYPFHPRFLRGAMLVCAVAAVLLGAWTASAVPGHALAEWIRTGLYLLLGGGFLFVFSRLRPRPRWGVEVGTTEILISRPLRGEPVRIPWESVSEILRQGRRKGRLLLLLDPSPGQVMLPKQLFLPEDFEALCDALEARKPPRRTDA